VDALSLYSAHVSPGQRRRPDLVFVVQSVAPRDLVVTRRHLTSY
jgi:hypothetical protein